MQDITDEDALAAVQGEWERLAKEFSGNPIDIKFVLTSFARGTFYLGMLKKFSPNLLGLLERYSSEMAEGAQATEAPFEPIDPKKVN